jgi:hypothetical protein
MKEQGLKAQGTTEESAMTAMNWLATQLAWEQRLVELRCADRPAKLSLLRQALEARAAKQAA